ncbi:hypothetical protein SAMN04488004_11672 [Loktanella salsilacus]|uniref:Uncharacterized protein n=1 Tax=Loktanella salsilacus TaxID=195913 RepID=A0A1I4H8F8_9RHOB|nr:hypothetical protein SAMN04488004_11672 [Loktanella salsilacus]
MVAFMTLAAGLVVSSCNPKNSSRHTKGAWMTSLSTAKSETLPPSDWLA